MMGLCYGIGYGVTKDEAEAYAYYSLAGTTHGAKLRDSLEKRMSQEALLRGQQRAKELQREIASRQAAK
jgi:TPR repeat protein